MPCRTFALGVLDGLLRRNLGQPDFSSLKDPPQYTFGQTDLGGCCPVPTVKANSKFESNTPQNIRTDVSGWVTNQGQLLRAKQ